MAGQSCRCAPGCADADAAALRAREYRSGGSGSAPANGRQQRRSGQQRALSKRLHCPMPSAGRSCTFGNTQTLLISLDGRESSEGRQVMVLHLLGKKGWNVYNSDNVARVRADEAAAAARDEAREQRMQHEDAARRLAILRGESPPPLTREEHDEHDAPHAAAGDPARPRKRRRLRGEDETDAEIRYARQDAAAGEQAKSTLSKPGRQHGDAPLLDHAGHLQLIPAPDEKAIREAERKEEKRKKDEQQHSNMRFTDAAGFKSNVRHQPWYAAADRPASSNAVVLADAQGKDVWGNEDPLRKEREQTRISRNDPFAAMQQAQRQLKQRERDKENWRRERDSEMDDLRRESRRKGGRRRGEDEDVLEGFSRDVPAKGDQRVDTRHGHRKHKHRHHRRRSRSRDRARERRRSSRE